MDTPLLDLTPGLAAAARVVGELPAGTDVDVDQPLPVGCESGGADAEAEADGDCKPD